MYKLKMQQNKDIQDNQNQKDRKTPLPDPKKLRLLPRRTVFPESPDESFPRNREEA